MSRLPQGRRSPQQWARELRRWGANMEHQSHSRFLRAMAPIIREDFAAHFRNTEAPYGKWPPRKDNLPHPLLILSGDMYRAATQEGAPGNITGVGDRELQMGVDGSVVNYTAFQQDGTRYIPARPFIWLSDEAEDAAFEAFADAAAKALL